MNSEDAQWHRVRTLGGSNEQFKFKGGQGVFEVKRGLGLTIKYRIIFLLYGLYHRRVYISVAEGAQHNFKSRDLLCFLAAKTHLFLI